MTLGSHQRSVGRSQVHITPRWILNALGPFDLDPAAAVVRPWDCAARSFTEADDGLSRPWHGRVFLNPPFDRYVVERWIQKLADHGHGTALLHARTEAGWFGPIWQRAAGILFLADRIKFCKPDGTEQPANSGAPAVLVAFGAEDLERLRTCGIAGVLVTTWTIQAAGEEEQMSKSNVDVTTYRNSGHVRWAMDAYGPGVDEGRGRYERLEADGRVQEISIADEAVSEAHGGDWYYVLDGRHHGPFISEAAAITNALELTS